MIFLGPKEFNELVKPGDMVYAKKLRKTNIALDRSLKSTEGLL